MRRDREALTREVKEVIVESLELDMDPEDVEDEESLFGVGLDSISTIELIVGIEETFGVEVDDDDVSEELVESVKSIVLYLERELDRRELSSRA